MRNNPVHSLKLGVHALNQQEITSDAEYRVSLRYTRKTELGQHLMFRSHWEFAVHCGRSTSEEAFSLDSCLHKQLRLVLQVSHLFFVDWSNVNLKSRTDLFLANCLLI